MLNPTRDRVLNPMRDVLDVPYCHSCLFFIFPYFLLFYLSWHVFLSPFSLPRRKSDPGWVVEQALLPPPPLLYTPSFFFWPKNSSALSSLVDLRRLVL